MSIPGSDISEALLREIVARVLAEVRAAQAKPGVLVLFSGALLGFEDAVASLKRLVTAGYPLDYTQTPAAERVLDQAVIEGSGMTRPDPGLVRSHDLLVLPTMTVNLAAKVAHGIGDCLASNVTAEFIMAGKPVVASVAGVSPDAPEKRGWFPTMPAGYQAMLRGTLETLASFGMHLTRPQELDQAVEQALGRPSSAPISGVVDCNLKLVTEGALAQVPDGASVKLRPKAMVTALAVDAARRRGITLIRHEARS